MIVYIQGDLTKTDASIILHGVNCQGVMGSGVAKSLFTKWPKVKELYLSFFTEFNAGPNGENFLGCIDFVLVDRKTEQTVINCFTQQYYGGDGRLYLSYDALHKCMEEVRTFCVNTNVNRIAMPKIGCGLAGGDWNIVKEILKSVFPEHYIIEVYSL